jgi:hypothetical protein
MRHNSLLAILVTVGLLCTTTSAQQVADTEFHPPIPRPAFPTGKGPVVLVDEAHFNFHTVSGRFSPFAELLRRDSYVVRGSSTKLSREALAGTMLLVISNPLAERNREDWSLPTPTAFADEEIAAVREWVRAGGALFLIADHMPFPGAAGDLARAFGFEFSNGFAVESKGQTGPIVFRRSDESLASHSITRGRSADEAVSEVTSFTGSAFRAGDGATPLLVLRAGAQSLEPKVAWEFDANTTRRSVAGWCQGAVKRFGKGRVAVFGEAAMFTAQLAGPNRTPMGMNSPLAPRNPQFLLNVVHWLSGALR